MSDRGMDSTFGTPRGRRAEQRTGRRSRLRGLALAIAVTSLLAAAAPAAASAISVSPLPGTTTAMPRTQISILGVDPAKITSVSVTGSSSGAHEGSLQPYASAQGASFIPTVPFTEGESVSVAITLSEGGPINDSFGIAHTAPLTEFLKVNGIKPEELQHFVTEPSMQPPIVKVNKNTAGLEGDIFLDPLPAPIIHVGAKLLEFEPVGPNGIMVLNPAGKLVYWHQTPGEAAADFQRVTYEGRKALAWWQGKVTEAAFGEGEGVIANSSYEPVAHIKAGNGLGADIHELYITPQGQAWIDAYEPVCRPTCDENTPPMIDAVAQEIDIHTGLVMWEWHALSRLDPEAETEAIPVNGVFDPFHLNSVQPLPSGRVLLSMRDTSGVYDVDMETGNVVWQIASKKSSFALGPHAKFYFQHNAILYGRGLGMLSLFDDRAGPPLYGPSRGLILKLNYEKKKAIVSHQYERPGTLTSAQAEGGMQVMPHGKVMVSYGNTPFFSEFTLGGEPGKRGALLFDAELPKGDGTYRVERFAWTGAPTTPPKAAAVRGAGESVSVYASWNGATKVASWRVLAGPDASSLSTVGSAAWSDFETQVQVSVPGSDTTFEVQALDAEGHVLGTSEAVVAS